MRGRSMMVLTMRQSSCRSFRGSFVHVCERFQGLGKTVLWNRNDVRDRLCSLLRGLGEWWLWGTKDLWWFAVEALVE